MNKNQKQIAIWLTIIIIITGAIIFLGYKSRNPGEFDAFAKCLNDKGAKFYGAFWCAHCQEQKEMFGKSKKYLPYVECSSSDGQSQTQICIDKKIEGYPTWEFADGTRMNGALPFNILSEKTACELPILK
jgi:hypothetical protein